MFLTYSLFFVKLFILIDSQNDYSERLAFQINDDSICMHFYYLDLNIKLPLIFSNSIIRIDTCSIFFIKLDQILLVLGNIITV